MTFSLPDKYSTRALFQSHTTGAKPQVHQARSNFTKQTAVRNSLTANTESFTQPDFDGQSPSLPDSWSPLPSARRIKSIDQLLNKVFLMTTPSPLASSLAWSP